MTDVTKPSSSTLCATRNEWIVYAVFSCLLFLNVFIWLWTSVWLDPDVAQAFLWPLIGWYVLRTRKDRLRAITPEPQTWSAVIMCGALLIHLIGVRSGLAFISLYAAPVFWAGLILCRCGWPFLRELLPALLLFIVLIPLPAVVREALTFRLQLLATRISVDLLTAIGVTVLREGNLVRLPGVTFQVTDACSGLRSATSLAACALALSFLSELRPWKTALLLLLSLAFAVFWNVVRIVGTAIGARCVGPWIAEGFTHETIGWLIFVAGMLSVIGIWKLLNLAPQEKSAR